MNKIDWWNYGNYSSDNYGVNTLAFEANGVTYYFSYKTLVAFKIKRDLYVRENVWGVTTGKHLNWIDGGDKKSRLSREEFEKKFDEVVKDKVKIGDGEY